MAVQETGNQIPVEEIERTLLEGIAAILSVDKASLAADRPFHELGVDSLGLVEILVFIEKTFKLQLIQSVASFIHNHL